MAMDTPSLLSRIVLSIDESVSLTESSTISDSSTLALASFAERLKPIVQELRRSTDTETLPVNKVLRCLDSQLKRGHELIRKSDGSIVSVKSMEDCIRDLGRCLGLLLMAWTAAPSELKERLALLQRDTMSEIHEGVVPDMEDVLVKVKKGEETAEALSELGLLIGRRAVGEEESGAVIAALLNRLRSGKNTERLKIISLLRSLAIQNDENKETMAGTETLSTVVRSLARDADESREAVGLLRDLSGNSKVRQRIGRVQGCIVMLVTLFNGDDLCTSHDAGKILMALSSSTQNVLLMAEAGYFPPLVHYLNEGSDMNKILMATAISRIELTDGMRATLGQEEGCIEPLVEMFTTGKLEAKTSALGALRNLSKLTENTQRLINAGIVPPLLQLLFSITSVILTLREPASAILASLAQSESILKHSDITQQILSLLNLSSPTIRLHLLRALNTIASHARARKVRAKMKENGAMQLLLPFLIENNAELRIVALNLLFNLSKDFDEELTGILGEDHLQILANIMYTTTSETEKAAAAAILSNIPTNDMKATEVLLGANLLPLLVSLLAGSIITSSPTRQWLIESVAGVLIRFTVPSEKKLQRLSVSHGLIPCLVKLLIDGSVTAKSRAATALAQLSQNSLSLKGKTSGWFCTVKSSESFCELHSRFCTVKATFCMVKAGAVSPLVRILEGKAREADEAVLTALATLMLDEIWENGSKVIEKENGILAIIRVADLGSLRAQEKAIWLLERIFRLEAHREKYGAVAQVVLMGLTRKGDPSLKPMIAKILAHLELLQRQSSYFWEKST